MRRFGMGVMPTVKVRARRSQFPRRGMGQDIDPSMGISQSDYESDQAPDPYGGVSTPTPAGGVSLATILPSVLAATPGIETGAAQIIKANNTPGIAVSGVVSGQGTAVGTSTGTSSGLIFLLIAAAVGFALIAGRK
jgi:hypothetical protein